MLGNEGRFSRLFKKVDELKEASRYIAPPKIRYKKVVKPVQYRFTVPSNFHLPLVLPKGILAKNLYSIVEHVWLRSTSQKWENKLKKNGYVPMSSSLMNQHMRNPTAHLKFLIDAGVLLCDNKYSSKRKISFGYKITDTYALSDPIRIELRRKKGQSISFPMNPDIRKKYPYITDWFIHLEFDYESAMTHILKRREQELSSVGSEDVKAIESVRNSFLHAFNSCERLKDRNYNISISKTNGRLNSTITMMRKDLKQFLTWKKQKLVSLDIKSSQPYFSVCLINRFKHEFPRKVKFFEGYSSLCSLYNYSAYLQLSYIFKFSITNHSTHLFHISPTSDYISMMSYRSEGFIDNQWINDDTVRYQSLIQNGILYDFLADRYNALTGKKFKDRNELKGHIFHVLYSSNYVSKKVEKRPVLLAIFKTEFPTVHKIFESVKSEKHNTLAIVLQQIESDVMLNDIAKRAGLKFAVFTIHDCLLVTERNLEKAKSIMAQELTRVVGFKPTISVEVL